MSTAFTGVFQRGFGTFPLRSEKLKSAVRTAAEIGYRAFDTAQWYGNEADLGAVLPELGIDRTLLQITTKVHPHNMSADKFMPSVEKSLRDLKTEQVDVLLLHWPPNDNPVEPSLTLLQEAYEKGYAKHIGVSNYTTAMMRAAVRCLDAKLVINQIEFHPLLNQDKVLATAAEVEIRLGSYCSIARGEIFKYPVLGEIGEGHGKSAAQVALRWILQKGVALNTMSTKRANMQANFDVMDFVLSSSEMQKIDVLTTADYRISNAETVPFAPVWD
jgi:2,5-diketo-D-gluconate reductase B